MSQHSVMITDGLEDAGLSILSGVATVHDRTGIRASDLPEALKGIDAVIVRSRTKMTAEVIASAPNLKVIGRAGIGVDTIDLDAAREHGVIVVNSPVATTTAVAELAMALILGLAREVPLADRQMKQGDWAKKDLVGVELAGSTLGIIGVGKIGFGLARRAASFRINIIGYDTSPPVEDMVAAHIEPVSLPDLYARSDFISLHVPLTPRSQGLVDAAAIARMKDGVRIVSTSRGGVIDEAALLAGLNSGKIAGAALDVFAKEPPGLTDLVAHPKVIATPHIGAQTLEAQVRVAEDIATEVLNALDGRPLRWRIA